MDKQSKIEFLNEGSEVVFTFPDGNKSIDYTSKKDAMEALTGMLKNKKVTSEEFAEFRDAILAKEELPWDDSEGITVQVIGMGGFPGMGRMNGMGMFGGPGILDILMLSAALSDLAGDNKPVTEPTFEMCGCGRHGKILLPDGQRLSASVYSKADAFEGIEFLKKEKAITEEDVIRLKKQVEESPLRAGKTKPKKATTS